MDNSEFPVIKEIYKEDTESICLSDWNLEGEGTKRKTDRHPSVFEEIDHEYSNALKTVEDELNTKFSNALSEFEVAYQE